MILKQVIHFPATNSVEAEWVDDDGNTVKYHSYADVQMDMLEADLGVDAPEYAELIATVRSNIQPPPPVDPSVAINAQIIALESQFTDTVKMRAILGDLAAKETVQGILTQIDALKSRL